MKILFNELKSNILNDNKTKADEIESEIGELFERAQDVVLEITETNRFKDESAKTVIERTVLVATAYGEFLEIYNDL